jgi:hypothetical protein
MRIDVLDPTTSERVFSCNGATLTGACPRAGDGDALPCAGMLLQPEPQIGWLGAFRFEVTGESPACPLRFLG